MSLKRFVHIFISFALLSCNTTIENEPYVAPDITGHWSLQTADVVDKIPFLDLESEEDPNAMAVEAYPYEYTINTDLVFSEDSIYRLYYPTELIGTGAYSIDTAHLNFNGRSWPIYLNGDTLLLYRTGDQDCFLEQVYYRTQYDDSIVSLIEKDTINYAELAGTWYLERSYNFDYGCEYILDFPYELSDSIVLSRSTILEAINANKTIEIATDGINKKYTLDYSMGSLYLTPGSWFTGEDPNIHFSRYY